MLALKIEQHYSKSQILEFYLNRVYFGNGAYRIGAASERHFGRLPDQVDLAQAALLAGLVQAPALITLCAILPLHASVNRRSWGV